MPVRYAKSAAEPALSVVIPSVPTHDHSQTVAHLREQTLSEPYEILVVDDASVDRSVARNIGLETADADVVALTDDDTTPPPEWLETIHREFANDPDLVCLEGPVYGGCRNTESRHYVGCNLAVRRKEALAVGGFRSEFSEWREDVEFGWRMERDADGGCRFEETMQMRHPSVPRTAFDPALEHRLKTEYPKRYATVMDGSLRRRLYRWGRSVGVIQPVHRVLNVLGYHRGPPR
ncbi:glycosyltransferase family 2 protein [Haloferax mediterranei ATCC 33500]|uniref:Family 2 glycosyl transferase n=1 Tax=Haloferax mediterranei (strain ATCC 33500 / DSM 1411 / JCM 8866 / NBRC 14739 / NCIMB 2177 / R-4) TaxID=523841 RepID=I3R1X7_HALMT|nr:glycosyltransferase family A protein [Haloferax mediterranei]AFK18237.1 glycosyl transferase, family 2 [Haloferax mediterranei ATCC 33500]AHZ22362.1 family 2 glycosyl transferase [Haloferax mediterranei ATCC 33500]EMA02492.1 family 2 glycosyl transferase [Haloferax mediterranei ATCC 33500]MDX5988325.1 glycosyltransferase family A protein [Haloferax mediterranei ATCC 33500]QCQ74759.1 glycosyltransferase family 2 protein [Haloferax mediterranei ATCC 33500]